MKKILLSIDIQNGFIRNEKAKKVEKDVKNLVKQGFFDTVIGTEYFNHEESMFVKCLGWNKLMTPEEQETPKELHNLYDKVMRKDKYTALNQEMLEYLKSVNGGKKPKFVYLVGLDTESCVTKTAVDLFEEGIIPIVLSDYTTSSGGDESYEAGMIVLRRFIGNKAIFKGQIKSKNTLEDIENIFK